MQQKFVTFAKSARTFKRSGEGGLSKLSPSEKYDREADRRGGEGNRNQMYLSMFIVTFDSWQTGESTRESIVVSRSSYS